MGFKPRECPPPRPPVAIRHQFRRKPPLILYRVASFPGMGENPIRRRGGFGGSINARIASKTTRNWASYFPSRAFTLRASSSWDRSIFRILTNARMMAIFTWIARSLFRTLESIATPCSVKA